MENSKNKCKLCGKSFKLEDDQTYAWCGECSDGIELISFLKDNMLPIDEKTILENIDKFITNRSVDDFIFNPTSLDMYVDLNYSIEQYEKIKGRTETIRKKLKLKK